MCSMGQRHLLVYMYVCIYVCIYGCRDSIMVRVLGWDMKVPGSIPADVNYTGYALDTSKSLGECLRLRSNHNLYLNGRLAEPIYIYIYIYISEGRRGGRHPRKPGPGGAPRVHQVDETTNTLNTKHTVNQS